MFRALCIFSICIVANWIFSQTTRRLALKSLFLEHLWLPCTVLPKGHLIMRHIRLHIGSISSKLPVCWWQACAEVFRIMVCFSREQIQRFLFFNFSFRPSYQIMSPNYKTHWISCIKCKKGQWVKDSLWGIWDVDWTKGSCNFGSEQFLKNILHIWCLTFLRRDLQEWPLFASWEFSFFCWIPMLSTGKCMDMFVWVFVRHIVFASVTLNVAPWTRKYVTLLCLVAN